MSRYAKDTSVSPERSRSQIETAVTKAGATSFGSFANAEYSVLAFELAGRKLRIVVPLPDEHDREITHTAAGKQRDAADRNSAHAKAVRQRWRALHVNVIAKLAAIEANIETIDEAFMPHIVMPDGKTIGEHALPAVREAYETGRVPALTWGES